MMMMMMTVFKTLLLSFRMVVIETNYAYNELIVCEMQSLTDGRIFIFSFHRIEHRKIGLKIFFLGEVLEISANFDFVV